MYNNKCAKKCSKDLTTKLTIDKYVSTNGSFSSHNKITNGKDGNQYITKSFTIKEPNATHVFSSRTINKK